MLHPKMKKLFIGVDIHKRTHVAVIINCFTEKLGELRFENNKKGFEKLIEFVKSHLKRGITPCFGLEDTASNGRNFTRFLLNLGYTVKSVDASLTYTERRNQAISHKTDGHDAFCVAKVLLNQLDTLPDASIHDDSWTLQLLVSRRNSIVKVRAASKNQVHSYISHHYPSYPKFFTVTYCKAGMEFFQNFPSPSKLRGITKEELAEFLSIHSSGFFGIEHAEKILKLVEKDGDTSTEYQETRDFIVSHCIKEIKHCNEELEVIEAEIKKHMKQFPYKLETMPGINTITAAMLISEIGDIRRFSSSDKMCRYSGISPVACSSGDKDKNFRNKQGNRRLYEIFRDIASRNICRGRDKKSPINETFLEYYNKKISQGKTKRQALIAVMRQITKVIYSMMIHQREYIKPTVSKTENA
ncbi:IS110 family RNA-guided transposase [Pseudobacteroides cellulosolvens]|uniref:IS110 family transposase n=1 Tax=Pseudobacteroides cellulosolvens TaxID=35825 RepID=UPI00068C983C|nr:IS110 family transposase [Pseudobacteroides cellulosolvens]